MAVAPAGPQRGPRFHAIDGLRGVAALSVAVFHFNYAIVRSAPDWLPSLGQALAAKGFMGVEIFFVISGFVIAHSVRDGDYSFRYLGLFALRRSIRLDPPYWCAIALECVLLLASARFFPSLSHPLPAIAQTLAHLVYAQEILGYDEILPVFWTLCYEIQFYLVLISLLVVWHKTRHLLPERGTRLGAIGLLAVLFASSLFVRYSGTHLPVRGLALERWFQFFLGALTYWVVSRRVAASYLAVAYGAIVATLIGYRAEVAQLLPVIISVGILLLGRRDLLDTVFNNRPLQFLGRISYSFYLIHDPIGWRWISLLERVAGGTFGLVWAWGAFFSALLLTVGASALMWRLIESPTMRVSKRIRLPARPRETEGRIDEPAIGTVTALAYVSDATEAAQAPGGVGGSDP
jgi:peptidoglycan/LPS O-acetylase OafA/YrhL